METAYFIAVDEFCTRHEIEISLISSLHEAGLIEITIIQEAEFLNSEELLPLERYIRLYHELNINPEGIDVIKHLLNRINAQHDLIIALRNRLRLYE